MRAVCCVLCVDLRTSLPPSPISSALCVSLIDNFLILSYCSAYISAMKDLAAMAPTKPSSSTAATAATAATATAATATALVAGGNSSSSSSSSGQVSSSSSLMGPGELTEGVLIECFRLAAQNAAGTQVRGLGLLLLVVGCSLPRSSRRQ